MLHGQIALARGRTAEALEAARSLLTEPAPRSGEPPDPTLTAARLLAARALQRRGELSAARTELLALLERHPEHEEAAGTLARVLLSSGALDQAAATAGAHPGRDAGGTCTEVLGLCAFYRGALDDADRHFAIVESAALRAGRPVALGRALSMRGMVAQQRGRLALASERYEQAAQLLGAAGEAHAAATADLNLGTALAERGRHGDALAHTAAAGRVFRALAASADWVAAEVNRANSLVAIGEHDSARAVLEPALEHPAASPHLRAFGQLVRAELARREGDLPAAIALGEAVLADAEARDDAHARISAHIGLAEAGAGADQHDIAELATSEDDRQRVALACARRSLLAAEPPAQLRAAGAAATSVAQRAEAADRPERAFRAFSVAAQLAAAARDALGMGDADPTAGALARRAAFLHEGLRAAAPPACAESMRRDPDLLALPAAAQLAPIAAPPPAFAVSPPYASPAPAAATSSTTTSSAAHPLAGFSSINPAAALSSSPSSSPSSALSSSSSSSPSSSSGLSPITAASALSPTAAAIAAASAAAAAPDPSRLSPAVLRRLLNLSRRLSSEVAFDRLLDEVIDTAIELTSAERGFLLLRQPGDQLVPVVARNFLAPPAARADAAAAAASGLTDLTGAAGLAGLAGPEQVSRSIAERAATSGEPIITIDAGLDDRFDTSASVAALRLRSVLAVPLSLRGASIGCIYVDHRLRRAAFDDEAASLLGELADIAAVAIGNAQLTGELRRHGEEIDRLNRALAAELAERDVELARVRAARGARGTALPGGDRRDLRHRYERIVGTSAPVIAMLGLVDRAAATSFPVVIVGESGTGKELVARALHDHSNRKDGPFVAVNCSALPDTLLESELFGHVRGAFTGADRERRGMFEVAHGGTLFLDEIADTSAAMQARLLRVLQDGVVRRIGDAATTTVDVRIVAATQRPLADLVTAGSFREDLRFRLEVLAIAVPPLRDRPGDLPILVEHLLGELAANRAAASSSASPSGAASNASTAAAAAAAAAAPPKLSRAAVRALAGHRWPGNVRELANVLAHGLAMADGEVIELGDLPPSISTETARPQAAMPEDGDLRLRPALRATERAYLAAAMARSGGNQTQAARLLGLSRFGLQKKLRRGDDSDPDEEDGAQSE